MKLRQEIREKILELFKELDVPAPSVGWWGIVSDKRLVEIYDTKVRALALPCEGCSCIKKKLREEIDNELFEKVVLNVEQNQKS